MNKRSVRAFAFGVIFSVGILFAGNFLFEKETSSVQLDEAKKTLEDSGFKVFTKEEFKQIIAEEKKKDEKKAKTKDKEPKDEAKEKASANNNEKQKNDLITYELVVNRGMTTGEIATILKEEGIIENQKDFEQYLVDVGYSKRIRVGTYQLNNQLSFREIALIITKR